jgi:hypothetical protein
MGKSPSRRFGGVFMGLCNFLMRYFDFEEIVALLPAWTGLAYNLFV